jgi:undecaprenyl-diphosphatase
MRYVHVLQQFEVKLFRKINQVFNRRIVNKYFAFITHMGGAIFTIASVLLLLLITNGPTQMTTVASAIALTVSHVIVQLVKRFFPRKRPYMALDEIFVTEKPLKDPSFPSGHSTAIFSVLIPFILFSPIFSISIFLLVLGLSVAISRIVLGLHYPSDVAVGILLGSSAGYFSYSFVQMFLAQI